MKLIIAIVRDIDNDPVSHGITSAGLRVTQVASTGGFLRRGNSTLLIGLEDEQVDPVIEIIRKNCSPASDAETRRASIFVLNVNEYIHF